VVQHTCGAVFEPRTHCASCGDPVNPRELTRID
jgi:rRNA maturation endonuclease Nob1